MNNLIALLVKMIIIAIAVLATVACMVWLVGWPHRTVWPGAITSGVLTAVLVLMGQSEKL